MSIAYDSRDFSHNAYAAPVVACHLAAATEVRSGVLWLLFSFQGRATRAQYWGASILGYVGLGVHVSLTIPLLAILENALLDVFVLVPILVWFWMMLAVQIKRWHDRGKSGVWCLIGLLPYIGAIWKFIELGCLSGTLGQNDYGPDPRGGVGYPTPRIELPDRHAIQRDIVHRAFVSPDSSKREAPKRQLIVPRRVATL